MELLRVRVPLTRWLTASFGSSPRQASGAHRRGLAASSGSRSRTASPAPSRTPPPPPPPHPRPASSSPARPSLSFAATSFPLAVVAAHTVAGLVGAFVVGGLREIGEPARKALILDLVRPDVRARGVGLYYLLRSLAIAPAATVGGLLWKVSPTVPFLMAG